MRQILDLLFGSGQSELRKTIEVFHENAETGAIRAAEGQAASLTQFAQEFHAPERGRFDRLMDAINRLPRPGLALGTLGLFCAAMIDPVWFAARMEGIALVPEPLWWLLGAIVSFYFGARHQSKGQEFQTQMSQAFARMSEDIQRFKDHHRQAEADTGQDADLTWAATIPERNPALDDWRASK
ncbi:hypothetical protein TG4357_00213 [Thalassovita gelatinovora]|uniref:Holin of 3TMs, for gene-transfer release n=1 Tax=Thalassovita gelatinovora TaxID=53501 RepID=A0A0P1F4E8_THAGE|nr:hypothetical protein TG4357_00213 [Thalassovita gelatinovora]SEQ07481.1 Holin of 3TMs, for gene-transfer release [Thalassovita gelatinovora]